MQCSQSWCAYECSDSSEWAKISSPEYWMGIYVHKLAVIGSIIMAWHCLFIYTLTTSPQTREQVMLV